MHSNSSNPPRPAQITLAVEVVARVVLPGQASMLTIEALQSQGVWVFLRVGASSWAWGGQSQSHQCPGDRPAWLRQRLHLPEVETLTWTTARAGDLQEEDVA